MRALLLVFVASVLCGVAYGTVLPSPSEVSKLSRDCKAAFAHADHSADSALQLWCPPSLRRYFSSEDCGPIPSEWWPESVRRLHPLFVYTEGHGAVIIVQVLTEHSERGIYVHLPISSQMRTLEDKNPPWHYEHLGKGVFRYERDPKA
jgi:hypothetical protein